MKKTFLVFIFVLFIIGIVNAVPHVTTLQNSNPSGTLNIEYPKNTYFQMNSPVVLHFHVYNSTGSAMFNTTTNCSIHFYNHSGNQIIQQKLSWDSNDIEWKFDLNNTFTSERTNYPYIVWCDSTTEDGYLSNLLYIGEKTDVYSTEDKLPVIIILVFIFATLFYLAKNWDFKFFTKDQKDQQSIMKVFLVVISMWGLLILLRIATLLGEDNFLSQNWITLLDTLYQMMTWINGTMTAFMLVLFLYNILLYLGVDLLKRGKK